MNEHIKQEFWCHHCQGYFLVKLNVALNYRAKITCPNPKCGEIHNRFIIDGVIIDQLGNKIARPIHEEEILCPPSSYSKKPRGNWKENIKCKDSAINIRSNRDGVPIRDPFTEQLLKERWVEIGS